MVERRYRFVGGPQDGIEIPVGDPVLLGTELPMPVLGQDRTAVYVFGDDGCFHFSRYGPPALASIDLSGDEEQKMIGIMQRLALALRELDAFYQSCGGYPPQTEIDGWVLRKLVRG